MCLVLGPAGKCARPAPVPVQPAVSSTPGGLSGPTIAALCGGAPRGQPGLVQRVLIAGEWVGPVGKAGSGS